MDGQSDDLDELCPVLAFSDSSLEELSKSPR